MSTAPNLLLTSEWLFPMLKEQLLALHERLQQTPSIELLAEISTDYQQLLEQLQVAEVVDFINLAYLLEMVSTAMAEQILSVDYVDITLAASESLLQALHHYVKIGTYEEAEIIGHCQQLHDLLAAKNIRLNLQQRPLSNNEVEAAQQPAQLAQNALSSDSPSENSTTSHTLENQRDAEDNIEDFLIHDEMTDAELDELERQLNPDYIAKTEAKTDPVEPESFTDVEFDVIESKQNQIDADNSDIDGNKVDHQVNQPASEPELVTNNSAVVLQSTLHEIVIPSDAQDSEPEIKEIFIEEAYEVLQEISGHAKQLLNYSTDDTTALITEVRRGFHTLKGSGRMVGAFTTAELAWSIENMLNRVLDGSIGVTSGMVQLVDDVIEGYPALIDIFEQQSSYPERLKIWMMSAAIYAKNSDADFDYSQLAPHSKTESISINHATEQANLAKTSIETSTNMPAAELVLEEMTTANARLEQAANEPLTDTQDAGAELQQVFATEASELLDDIDRSLAKVAGKPNAAVEDDLVRAFHTLRGAASSQSLTAISDISATVEHSLEQLQQQDEPMTSRHLQTITQSVELIKGYINKQQATASQSSAQQMQQDIQQLHEAFDSSRAEENEQDTPFNVADLINEHVDDVLDAQWELAAVFEQSDTQAIAVYAHKLDQQCQLLLERTQGSAKFVTIISALQHLYQQITETPVFAQNAEVIESLIAGHDELTGLLDSLAGSMALKLDDKVVKQLEHWSEQASHLAEAVDGRQSAEANPENDNQANNHQDISIEPVVAALQIEEIETDAELLDIFLEEAQDIDNDVGQQLTLWKQNPESTEAIAILQRHLHTIKGGARMAGINSIAELMHEAETLYEQFVGGVITPDMAWIQVMQAVQDTLASQVEYLATQGKSFYVTDFIKQLRAISKAKELPDGFRLTLPKTPNDNQSECQSTISTNPQSAPELYQDSAVNVESQVSEEPDSVNTTFNYLNGVLASENTVMPISDSIEQSSSPESEVDSIELEFDRLKSESWASRVPDPDILEIFLEEADEVLEHLESHFQDFQRDMTQQDEGELSTDNIISPALYHLSGELQKLNGGARMVYADSVADVTQHLEIAYAELLKPQQITPSVYPLLSLTHEWLEQAIYLIKHGINPPAADALITKLADFKKHPDALQALPDVSLQGYIEAINRYEKWRDARLGLRDISQMPAHLAVISQTEKQPVSSSEMIRVPSTLMEKMINLSGESAIHRSRIELSVSSVGQTIQEMESTVQRLAEQLRRMDIELETQVRSQLGDNLKADADFDPLEMDQYSVFNQLSKSLSESASDLLDIRATLQEKARDTEGLLLQLSQTQTELQEGLMTSRMMPFAQVSPRLQRTVRQTASELGKSVELVIINEQDEIDRTVLERITAPLEHMLRNSVDHGIEMPAERREAAKPDTGRIVIDINREGGEIVISVSDDGQGIDVNSVRQKAISRNLINKDDTTLTDMEVMQYIFHAGLSTASSLTQISGRGVGMDVVLSEVRQLGGTVSVQSQVGQGTEFVLRLPLTIAITEALVVRSGSQKFAVPLIQIDRIERLNTQSLLDYYQSEDRSLEIAGNDYRVRYLNEILSGTLLSELSINSNMSLPVIILKNQAGQRLALQVDEIVGSRIDAVVKPLGRPLANVTGFSAATITGDGAVMLILDALDLMRNAPAQQQIAHSVSAKKQAIKRSTPQVLIVDDSVTVRKVTSRILERQGYKTFAARDGVEALEMLQSLRPDVMLLDIEMPRMDGFEVASHVRHDPQLNTLPIIMITSRTGDKHHQRARQIGVNAYLGKPFQEALLISTIQSLIKQASGVQGG